MRDKCQIEVIVTPPSGLSIYCLTCHESVAWNAESFTEAEIRATAKGHRKVMKAAYAASQKFPHK